MNKHETLSQTDKPINPKETTSKIDYLTPPQRVVVTTLEQKLQEEFGEEGSGHDWLHLNRVRNTAVSLARGTEGANVFVVEVAALLHDYKDPKIEGSEARHSVRQVLVPLDMDEETIGSISDITENIGFSKADKKEWTNIEGKIVEDADRIDAIGATGIARTFAFGGNRGESHAETVKHFHEKLFKLRNLMNTQAGKIIANRRHEFMVEFLGRFSEEMLEMESFREQLLNDVNNLNTLGATGIATAFADAGKRKVPMYNGKDTITNSMKLKLQTPKEIAIAKDRRLYMTWYLAQLAAEQQGQK
jgi:uncharacterized protein